MIGAAKTPVERFRSERMRLFDVKVHNLGRIKDAELCIRPLTVFFGPNNTNKTWVANAMMAWRGDCNNRAELARPRGLDLLSTPWRWDAETGSLVNRETSRFVAKAASVADRTTVIERIRASDTSLRRTNPVQLAFDAKGLAPYLFASESELFGASAVLTTSDEVSTERDRLHCPAAEELTLSFSNVISPSSLLGASGRHLYLELRTFRNRF